MKIQSEEKAPREPDTISLTREVCHYGATAGCVSNYAINHLTEDKSLSLVKDATVCRVYSTSIPRLQDVESRSVSCTNVQETRFKSASGQEVRNDAV